MNREDSNRQEQIIQKKVYIYAQVDIDKLYTEITSKSKKIQAFVSSNSLSFNFYQEIRQLKNFRICFDHQIQQLINKKQLSSDLRIIKKHVFVLLEDFIIERYKIYLEDQRLHDQYQEKLSEIQEHFTKRIQELSKSLDS